ncbi:hypothetical protein GURKE_01490 [Brevundimonas phage vB_BpoS-Gurke]|uniref:Uncharacterized protein n=1 Tax=Brevundimonas phage vB_BpoS-Gurke TaxID=2948599 RepID=A0A9E7N3H2_9CAUD|nr:hypothetical protein GURKE_01490 [Brevundimonas phage vB_BpoS-Gurke]
MAVIEQLHLGPITLFYAVVMLLTMLATSVAATLAPRIAGAYLAGVWLIYTILRAVMPAYELAPVMTWFDVFGLILGLGFCARSGYARVPGWSLVFVVAYFIQMFIHLLMICLEPKPAFAYYLALNMAFLGQCAAVVWGAVFERRPRTKRAKRDCQEIRKSLTAFSSPANSAMNP